MSCKITFESIITFREYDLLLILHTWTINVEFYSLSNTFYFIILCYIEQKIYLFLWRPAISSFKCPKKSGQQGSTRHLKVSTLKVKINPCCVIFNPHTNSSHLLALSPTTYSLLYLSHRGTSNSFRWYRSVSCIISYPVISFPPSQPFLNW